MYRFVAYDFCQQDMWLVADDFCKQDMSDMSWFVAHDFRQQDAYWIVLVGCV